jgi:hypothetical protein
VLDGVGMLHLLTRAPAKTSPAWLNMTLYWAAEIVAVYAALRMFGVALNPARVVLAHGPGYVVTRRSLPLAGAAITEVLLTFALHWVGAPLAPALAAVVTYRLFNLILISVPSLLANQQLRPSLAADVKPLQRARALALSRNDCTSASPAAGRDGFADQEQSRNVFVQTINVRGRRACSSSGATPPLSDGAEVAGVATLSPIRSIRQRCQIASRPRRRASLRRPK